MQTENQVQRPTFLTVLCILTFLGSSISLISAVFSYLTANTTAQLSQVSMRDSKEQLEGTGASGFAEKLMSDAQDAMTPENIKYASAAAAGAAVLTLLGAILMFGLNKKGYLLYVLGTIIAIVAPAIIYGPGNLFSLFSLAGGTVIGILFVILYALNYKHLR